MRTLGEMLQKAQRVKSALDDARARMKSATVEGQTAGGVVKVVASCDKQIVSIQVDHQRVSATGMAVEVLIAEAANDALAKAEVVMKEELNKAMGVAGLSLPGLF